MTTLPHSPALTATLARATANAQALGQTALGPEHLLLALLEAPAGPVTAVLAALQLPVATIRTELAELMPGRRPPTERAPSLTESARAALAHAEASARHGQATQLDTDHLLLGIALGVESLAGRVLLDVGAAAEVIRGVVERERAARPASHCPHCGQPLEPHWRFCPLCATPRPTV